MTSNVGSKEIHKGGNLGFTIGEDANNYSGMKDKAISALKRVFNPEFLNRVDEVVVFHPLNKKHIGQIIDLMLDESKKQLEEKSIALEITASAKNHLIEKGYDVKYGARPLRRTIQREIEDPLANEILKGVFKEGSKAIVDCEEEKIVFKGGQKKKKKALETVETSS
jgi:ATP-dependent Clp protease ATP-binding subunit ClpC